MKTNANSEILDIIFEQRNKTYGAYQLRQSYGERMRNSLGISLFICLCFIFFIFRFGANPSITSTEKGIITEVMEVDKEQFMPKKLPEQPKQPEAQSSVPPPSAPTNRFVDPVVKPDESVKNEEKMTAQKDIIHQPDTKTNTEGDPNKPVTDNKENKPATTDKPTAPVVEKTTKTVNNPPIIHTFAEVMPEFEGGQKALMKYLAKHIKYPSVAIENQIEGTVFVEFIVNEDGNVSSPRVVRGNLGGGCEEEALRVIGKLPKWKAGKQNGKAVKVRYTVPVKFQLN